jgi:membrane protein YqaA with SNARE-associated domain
MNTLPEAHAKPIIEKKPISARDKCINIGILVFLTIVGVVISIKFDWQTVRTFLKENPSWTIFISLVVYALLGLTFIPSTPLVIVVAYNIGVVPAIIVAGVGQSLASWLEYYEGMLLDNSFDLESLTSKLPKKIRNMPITSPVFQYVARVLAPKPLAFLSGAYRVPLMTYLGISLLENSLGSGFFALTGLGILKIALPNFHL